MLGAATCAELAACCTAEALTPAQQLRQERAAVAAMRELLWYHSAARKELREVRSTALHQFLDVFTCVSLVDVGGVSATCVACARLLMVYTHKIFMQWGSLNGVEAATSINAKCFDAPCWHVCVHCACAQLLWTVDQGKGANISGIADAVLKERLRTLFKLLRLKRSSCSKVCMRGAAVYYRVACL